MDVFHGTCHNQNQTHQLFKKKWLHIIIFLLIFLGNLVIISHGLQLRDFLCSFQSTNKIKVFCLFSYSLSTFFLKLTCWLGVLIFIIDKFNLVVNIIASSLFLFRFFLTARETQILKHIPNIMKS